METSQGVSNVVQVNPEAYKGTERILSMNRTITNIFVSYSRVDVELVEPIVALLRVNTSYVFRDIDSISPGKKWRSEIDNALTKADLLVLFWCDHANDSENVRIEWSAAVMQDKDILPLLLDDTPLPIELSQYQWIDFQKTIEGRHHKGPRIFIKSSPEGSEHRAAMRLKVAKKMASDIEKEIVRLLKL